MNWKPDEMTLAAWFEGQLDADLHANMNAYLAEHPELIAQKEAFALSAQVLREKSPASIEPPYPDFFNSQVQKRIREERHAAEAPAKVAEPKKGASWLSWFLPAAAAASFEFFAGTKFCPAAPAVVKTPVPAATQNDALYTPYGDVDAQVTHSNKTGSTVIVLDGLEAIPDNVDIVTNRRADQIDETIPVATPKTEF